MSAAATPAVLDGARADRGRSGRRRKQLDRFGDRALFGVCLAAALIAVAVLVLVGYQVVHGAAPAISEYGLGFLTDTTWQPNFGEFGAGSLIFGTAVSSLFALLLGAPIAISIGLYLSLLAPSGVRGVVAPLVEMLAAIPSVILGFWGVLVLAPFVQGTLEPWLHDTLRLHPDLRRPRNHRRQHLHRQPDPDDHGRADHRLDLPRPLPGGAAGGPGRGQRARRDPLGGGARGGPALDRLRRRRCLAARASGARSARRSRSPR